MFQFKWALCSGVYYVQTQKLEQSYEFIFRLSHQKASGKGWKMRGKKPKTTTKKLVGFTECRTNHEPNEQQFVP